MANLSTLISQSSLLLPRSESHSISIRAPQQSTLCLQGGSFLHCHFEPLPVSKTISSLQRVNLFSHKNWHITAVSDSAASPNPIVEPVMADLEPYLKPDSGSGDGFGEGGNGKDYYRGGGGSGNGGDDDEAPSEDGNSGDKGTNALSMSQKLTLGYAALVGLGGLMGFLKSGSQNSLAAGGISALLLYYVYTQLPTKPVFASSVGLGLSAALLVVMGSRYRKSGKVFPAGVVSLVSLIMTGGYLHGIIRAAAH